MPVSSFQFHSLSSLFLKALVDGASTTCCDRCFQWARWSSGRGECVCAFDRTMTLNGMTFVIDISHAAGSSWSNLYFVKFGVLTREGPRNDAFNGVRIPTKGTFWGVSGPLKSTVNHEISGWGNRVSPAKCIILYIVFVLYFVICICIIFSLLPSCWINVCINKTKHHKDARNYTGYTAQ